MYVIQEHVDLPMSIIVVVANVVVNVENVLGLMVSIQFSHTSPLKCRCFSPFGNLMSCSFLTPWLCSHSCFSYGDVICGISYLCSFGYLFYGDVIYDTTVIYLTICTTSGTTFVNISIIDGCTLLLIIFCALKCVFSCCFFTLELEALLSSTLFFFLKTLLGEYDVAFFLLSSVVHISSLVLLALASGLCQLSF